MSATTRLQREAAELRAEIRDLRWALETLRCSISTVIRAAVTRENEENKK